MSLMSDACIRGHHDECPLGLTCRCDHHDKPLSTDDLDAYAEHGVAQAAALLAWTAPTPTSASQVARAYGIPAGIDPTRPAAQPRGLARLRISDPAATVIWGTLAAYTAGIATASIVAAIIIEVTR